MPGLNTAEGSEVGGKCCKGFDIKKGWLVGAPACAEPQAVVLWGGERETPPYQIR